MIVNPTGKPVLSLSSAISKKMRVKDTSTWCRRISGTNPLKRRKSKRRIFSLLRFARVMSKWDLAAVTSFREALDSNLDHRTFVAPSCALGFKIVGFSCVAAAYDETGAAFHKFH